MIRAYKKELPLGFVESSPEIDPEIATRVSFIFRLESLVNVGCHFLSNDLTPETWDQLITVALERQFIEEKKREKDKEDNLSPSEARAREEIRQRDKIPPKGQSLFPQRKPIK